MKDVSLQILKVNDKNDIARLEKIHKMPSISRYVAISDNYFDYVTNTKGVTYIKIFYNQLLVGGIHIESDILPPLIEVGASCSRILANPVSAS